MHALPDLRSPFRHQRLSRSWVALLCGLLLGLLVAAPVLAAPPNATNITVTTNEDTPVIIEVTLPVNTTLLLVAPNPSHGSSTVNGDEITYTPGANQITQVTFNYHFCDTATSSCGLPGTITVNITPVNDDPTAIDDTATTTEDTAVSIAVLANDSTGPANENQTKSLVSVQGVLNGTAAISGANIVYTPSADFCGVASFTYRMSDGVSTDDATVTVTVSCVNDPPAAVADTATMAEDSTTLIDVLANDNAGPANENQAKTLVSVQNAVNGTAVINSEKVSFTPTSNFCGQASFNYTMKDDSNVTRSANVTITVTCVPEAPTLTLSPPYGPVGHSFLINVILTSVDTPVAAVDFVLDYDESCLADSDATPNGLEDDITTTLPTTGDNPSFAFAVDDSAGQLRFVVSSLKSPTEVIAGPSRIIATIKFLLLPNCPSVDFAFANPLFFGTNTLAIPGGLAPAVNDVVVSANQPPTNITLSSEILHDPAPGKTVGTLTTIDADTSDTHTYSLVPSFGDNSKFTLSPNNTLVFIDNGTVQSTYSVRIRTEDQYGGFYEKTFTIRSNRTPTGINLTSTSVPESLPGATVGTLSTVDPDTSDAHTYTVVSSTGDSFEVQGNILKLKPSRVAVDGTTYTVVIRTTDQHGGFYELTFNITGTRTNLRPDANDDGVPAPIVIAGSAQNIAVLANDFDPDGGTVAIISSPAPTNGTKGTTSINGNQINYTPTDPNYNGPDSFTYSITDNDSPTALTDNATVNLVVLADRVRGDCNGDGAVNAGDLAATGLEIFDGDGSTWYLAYGGSFAGFPMGCNSNNDTVIDAGDIACTAAKIFNPTATCAPITTASSSVATLAVSGNLQGAPGSTVNVPISLAAGGNSVAAAAFAVEFDNTALSFDTSDADGNGVPDAVQFNVPNGLMTSANYNAAESRVEIIITGLVPPFPLLSDGTIATVSLTVNSDADAGASAVTLSNSSLGSDAGASIPMEIDDGAIDIAGQATEHAFYLPLISAE